MKFCIDCEHHAVDYAKPESVVARHICKKFGLTSPVTGERTEDTCWENRELHTRCGPKGTGWTDRKKDDRAHR